ncbi:WUSCHEL-related homeobox 8 [Apostasia shenzhenica]|uniref:WUSCHEL-related homeobox 8 n=1 Tax=Apostasia shenzhenica TaxID=1088818 RepID=A0A2I0AX28_9ASPA|nr:WUSCHEL-related homeobox 8 [Apostasia shenzhenica]
MAWEKGCSSNGKDYYGWSYEEERGRGQWQGLPEGLLCVKVMTDEQMEVLRRQIAVYATICEQLVEMHRAFSAKQESITGIWSGSIYCDPSSSVGFPKISARQRWTPTPMQLQILEGLFEQGNGTPSKQKIKGITSELSKHGQVSEANVYNWFQNRRARTKRKQASQVQSNTESETEAEVESPNDVMKKPKLDKEGLHYSNEVARSSGCNENAVSNPRIKQMIGKMEIPGYFSHFQNEKGFNFSGL